MIWLRYSTCTSCYNCFVANFRTATLKEIKQAAGHTPVGYRGEPMTWEQPSKPRRKRPTTSANFSRMEGLDPTYLLDNANTFGGTAAVLEYLVQAAEKGR